MDLKPEAATFDPEDRLTQTGANSDFYARYDGDGLRATKTDPPLAPTWLLYDGGKSASTHIYNFSGGDKSAVRHNYFKHNRMH